MDDVTRYDLEDGKPKDSTLKRQQSGSFIEFSVSDLEFIESPHVVQCSNNGME